MKPLKKLVLIALTIPILLVLISFFLPSKYRVQRSVTTTAKTDTVFPLINTLKHWQEWSAWTVTRFPGMTTTYAGPDAGVGASMTWDGKESGHGNLTITSSDPAKGITYDLDFEHGKYLSKGTIAFQAPADSLIITWSNEGDLGWNPVSRFFGLLMDKMMGSDMQTGLDSLRRKAEEPIRVPEGGK